MTGRPRPQCNRGATLRRVHWSCGFRKRGPGSKRSTGFVRAIPVIRRVRPPPLLLALRQSRYLLVLEAPPINAIESAFSASIVLIALVVLCDQGLLGRLSFRFRWSRLTTKIKVKHTNEWEELQGKPRSHTVALVVSRAMPEGWIVPLSVEGQKWRGTYLADLAPPRRPSLW